MTRAQLGVAVDVVESFLDEVDAVRPELVVGCYVVGSLVHGDYQPRHSDIDLVAVVDGAIDPATIEDLRGLHRRQHAARLDGIYVTAGQLAAGTVPEARFHHGVLEPRDPYGATPVTRRELVAKGVRVRGVAVDRLEVRDEPDELRAWVRENLHTYWADWVRKASGWTLLSLYALIPRGIEWCVLGTARMACTLATGDVVSKTDAGEWARRNLDARYESILSEALRIRSGRFSRPINADRKAEALAFMAHVVQTY